jgi:hypothetical protein
VRPAGPPTTLRVERRAAPAWYLRLPAAARPTFAPAGLEPLEAGPGGREGLYRNAAGRLAPRVGAGGRDGLASSSGCTR